MAIAQNKKAYHNYEILEKIEAGIVLSGFEVKAIRGGQVILDGSYISIDKLGKIFLIGANIKPLQKENVPISYQETRSRELLLNKKEIKELKQQTETIGNTLIPLSVYNKDGLIKIEIALVRGKKKFDKRQTIKKREANIEIMRTINKTKFIITLLILSTFPILTEAKVLLKVPYFQQQYLNSCEAGATRMVLAYHGIDFENEDEILKAFNYNPRTKDVINNIWDDPQEMFVGFIDKRGAENGYGIYGQAVTKGVRSFDMDAKYYASSSINLKLIAQNINEKKPVMFWGYTSLTQPPYTWKTESGKTVKAFRGEHVRVVVGFEGSVNNPTGFYVHDPINGKKNEYWSKNKLLTQLNAVPGVTDQLVIVQ